MKKRILKKSLVISIMLLFILSIIPSTESNELSTSICSDEPFGIRIPDSSHTKNFYNLKECSAGRKIAYGYCSYSSDPWEMGPWWFYLDGPEFDFKYHPGCLPGAFLTGSTYTNEERWIACEYYTGALWEIDPESCDMESIGGGGTGLNGLAYNPVDNVLYGASRSGLWLIDLETGEQEYVGDFVNSVWMVAIAFDADGVLYGWDINTDYLYTIDLDAGEATEVGPLGIDLNHGQDGAFEFEDDILYLAAYTNDSHSLYKCDEDTGECTLVGPFLVNLPTFAIPYGGQLPIKPYISGPRYGRPGLPNIFHVDKEENTNYVWNWGNGNYSSSPSHKWAKLGTYNVSVNARNLYGAIDSDPINIKIEDFRFNKALVFGRIHDVDIIENLTMIKADSLLYLGKPDLIKWYHSGERIIISETLFGRIKSDSVIGFFNVDVIG